MRAIDKPFTHRPATVAGARWQPGIVAARAGRAGAGAVPAGGDGAAGSKACGQLASSNCQCCSKQQCGLVLEARWIRDLGQLLAGCGTCAGRARSGRPFVLAVCLHKKAHAPAPGTWGNARLWD